MQESPVKSHEDEKFDAKKIRLSRLIYRIGQNGVQKTFDLRIFVNDMHLEHIAICILLAIMVGTLEAQEGIYTGKSGSASFKSDAPLELIQAESKQLSAAINPLTNGVAFSIRINSFVGFNSAVQREHFMENYMEANRYPVATFTGKIIEQLPFTKPGQYEVRVKGILNIHGIGTERIIPGRFIVSKSGIVLHASFSVPLHEHDIHVPKLLSQKIAETISVQIDIDLQKTD